MTDLTTPEPISANVREILRAAAPGERSHDAPTPHVDLDDIAEWIDADRHLTAQIDDLDARHHARVDEIRAARDVIRARIQERIGDAAEARVGGVPVIRWARHKAATYIDRTALERDHPDIARRYLRTKKPARPWVFMGGDAR